MEDHSEKKFLEQYDRTITIAVDVQNDFCPGGSLAVTDGDEVVAPLNRIMAYTRKVGGTVIATRDWHPKKTPHFDKWPVHCVASTEGAHFHPDLDIESTDLIINKGTGQTDGYSGFEGQSFTGHTIKEIMKLKVEHERIVVLIGGLATDYCVGATALDAAEVVRVNNFHCGTGWIDIVALVDAMRAVDVQPGDGEKMIAKMAVAGIHIATVQELLG